MCASRFTGIIWTQLIGRSAKSALNDKMASGNSLSNVHHQKNMTSREHRFHQRSAPEENRITGILGLKIFTAGGQLCEEFLAMGIKGLPSEIFLTKKYSV